MGIISPTEIQQQSIGSIISGQNLVGTAPTGSGKTACFAVPMLQKLSKDLFGIFGIVITPTRELAY